MLDPAAAPTPRFDVDAIAFDLDGTLLDTVHDIAAALAPLLAELGLPPLDEASVARKIGKGAASFVSRAIAEARGVAPDERELAALLERFEASYGEVLGRFTRPFPGAAGALASLRASGYRLAVVTNKPRRFVEPHLVAAGLDGFDVIVGGGDTPVGKPDPAPMRLAAARLGVDARRMLVVGDSRNDAAAARSAGCPVLIVAYGYSEGVPLDEIDCDGIVPSLSTVAELQRRTVPA